MTWLADNAATIVVLLLVIAVVALATRALVKDGVADCSTCNGNCGSCPVGCATPKIQLSPAQEERLRLLKAKAEQHV